MSRRKLIVSLLGVSAICMTAFFNCAKPNVISSADLGSSGSGSGSGADFGTQAFASGDKFNYSLVATQTPMIQAQLTADAYATSTAARAVAINAQGLGYVSESTAGNQQANQMALESCYAIGGSQPCVLLATSGTFAIGASALTTSSTYTFSVPTNTTVTSSNIPFLKYTDRASAASGFAAASSPKAMAISIDGTYMVASASGYFGTNTDSRQLPASSLNVPASDAEAQRMALETCEMMSKYLPCTIFAVDSSVTLNPASFNYTPVIDYAPTSITEVPGVSMAIFNAAIKSVVSAGYVYISADGDGGANVSATTANSSCVTNQSISNSGTYPCFQYSAGGSVAMSSENLSAVKHYSLATHCEIMPRSSCAAHASVGCSGAKLYVISGNTVNLTTCP